MKTATAARNSRRLGALVLLSLLAGSLAFFAWTVWRQREQALTSALVNAETHARGFEDHLTQVLQLVELVMSSVEPTPGAAVRPEAFAAAATVALRPAPYLRSLSLLDADDRVIASSAPANVGRRVDLADLYPVGEPQSEVLRIALPRPGRDIGESPEPGDAASQGLSVIALVRNLPHAGSGGARRIVAAVNPDHFVHHFSQLLDPRDGRVQWLRYDGALLASSRAQELPGQRGMAGEVPARLVQFESGRFGQTLPDGTQVQTAYRASSRYPALIAVHVDRERVLATWRDETRQMDLLVLPALVALGIAGALALRWQSRHDAQQSELRRQMQLAASVFEASSEAIVLTSPEGHILSCNPAFLRMTGYAPSQVIGRNYRIVVAGPYGEPLDETIWEQLLRQGNWQGEITSRRRDGSLFVTLTSVNSVRDDAGRVQHYVGVTRDISELKRAEAAEREAERQRQHQAAEKKWLLELAVRDPLTGLHNRRYLDETLPRELAKVKRLGDPLAVVMVDIDHFKRINDSHGHAAGDAVIRALAGVLASGAREGDVVSRYGGEEFVVVMPGMDANGALARARHWAQQAAALKVSHGPIEIGFTLSAGVAAFPVHGSDADGLLRAADHAMYGAKSAGRDRVVEAPAPA